MKFNILIATFISLFLCIGCANIPSPQEPEEVRGDLTFRLVSSTTNFALNTPFQVDVFPSKPISNIREFSLPIIFPSVRGTISNLRSPYPLQIRNSEVAQYIEMIPGSPAFTPAPNQPIAVFDISISREGLYALKANGTDLKVIDATGTNLGALEGHISLDVDLMKK